MPSPWPVASSLTELLGGEHQLVPMSHVDSLSGATFSRVELAGRPHVVKRLDPRRDWVMRATGDTCFRPLVMWREGLFAALPGCLDPVVIGVAEYDGGVSLLMPDISADMVPAEEGLTEAAHAQFMRHMATLHARFLGWSDEIGLCSQRQRWSFLTPQVAASLGSDDLVPRAVPGGWTAMAAAEPAAWKMASSLAQDPSPLVRAMADLPQTLVHGDWKGGNLGLRPEGRTALLDWAFPGQDNPLVDLCWYLAVNCDRLPEGKDETAMRYRAALQAAGVDTTTWWDDALALSQLVAFVQMGWSKSGEELAWWAERAVKAAAQL